MIVHEPFIGGGGFIATLLRQRQRQSVLSLPVRCQEHSHLIGLLEVRRKQQHSTMLSCDMKRVAVHKPCWIGTMNCHKYEEQFGQHLRSVYKIS